MAITALIRAALSPILEGILRFIPDKNKRAEAKEMFEGQMLNAMTALVQGQLDINKQEAKHGSMFVAGWRPGIGWICGAALAWNFILQPLLLWAAWLMPEVAPDIATAPRLEIDELLSILGGMLGLGGLRTYEKRLGVARTEIKGK